MHPLLRLRTVRRLAGLARSLLIYYVKPGQLWRMRRFYGQFIQAGDLCFDIGAHVGNRLFVWSRLGARIVAVEPQPICMRLLRAWYGKQPNIVLVEAAAGASPGWATLFVSERTPTVSTVSASWIEEIQQDPSFAGINWDHSISVPVTTLDNLIECHGVPAYCKIDVEGLEPAVLRGLSQPLPLLSFEYLPPTIHHALACVERLRELGDYQYNWFTGERHYWESSNWLTPAQMIERLQKLKPAAASGDIFAQQING